MNGVREFIMRQTGHKTVATLRRHIRSGEIFRENAAAGLGIQARPMNVFLFSLRTQKWRLLETGEMQYPCFSRDGRYIYFFRWKDEHVVFRVNVTDRKVERIDRLQDLGVGVDRLC